MWSIWEKWTAPVIFQQQYKSVQLVKILSLKIIDLAYKTVHYILRTEKVLSKGHNFFQCNDRNIS